MFLKSKPMKRFLKLFALAVVIIVFLLYMVSRFGTTVEMEYSSDPEHSQYKTVF